MELGLNRLDRLVSITPCNDNGAAFRTLNLENKLYTEAIELLLSDQLFTSYLSEDALLSFTVVSTEEDALLAGIQQCQGYGETQTMCRSTDTTTMEAAHHKGLSLGKYKAYLILSAYDETITAHDCKNLSMGQIQTLIDQYVEDGDTPYPHRLGEKDYGRENGNNRQSCENNHENRQGSGCEWGNGNNFCNNQT